MEVEKVYQLNRGNQNQLVGLIIKGATASVQVFGSQSPPAALADMEDCTDSVVMDNGTWTFAMLPEYIYFTGTADDIQILGMGAPKELDIEF